MRVQICGGFNSTQYCNPLDWVPPVRTGTVVQTWGTPPCDPDSDPGCSNNGTVVKNNCTLSQPCSGPSCCTPTCEVIALGNPAWAVAVPENPHNGGILGTFAALNRTHSGFLQCLHVRCYVTEA